MKKENIIKKYTKDRFEDYDRGEIAVIVLKSLLAIGALGVFIALPGVAYIFTMFKPKNSYERQRVNQSIGRLEKEGYIEIIRKANGIEKIKVTQKGKIKVLRYDFDKIKIQVPSKWDGVWRLVMFDVPEDRKKVRNALNYKLKDLGFIPVQKSVFAFPYECRDEIDFVGNFYGARKYIRYMEVKDIDEDGKLRKNFGLLF